MGAVQYHRPKGQTDREHLQSELFTDTKFTIIDSVTKGTTFYGAVHDGLTDEVWALIVLQQRLRGHYNYSRKVMDETVGPYYYDCPDRILDLLTPTENECARAWRMACRTRNAQRAARPKIKAGDTVRFADRFAFGDGHEGDTFVFISGSTFRAAGSINRYRIPRWRDRSFEKVSTDIVI